MVVVGLDELRLRTAELVRRAEDGEEVVITVAGRPRVRLVPASRDAWRPFSAAADLFDGEADASWTDDQHRLDDALPDR